MNNDVRYLACRTGVIEGNKLYVVNTLFGLLLEYDLCDFSYKVLTKISLPDPLQPVRVNTMVKLEQKIYMTLLNSYNVFAYDLESGQIEIYGNSAEYTDGIVMVLKSILYEGALWLFPFELDQPIRVFNIQSGQYQENRFLSDSLKEIKRESDENCLMTYGIALVDDTAWIPVFNTSYIISVNLKNGVCSNYRLNDDSKVYTMNYDCGQFWLTFVENTSFVRWSPDSGILDRYELEGIATQEMRGTYCGVYSGENIIVAIPVQYNHLSVIDKKTKQALCLQFSKEFDRVYNKQREMFVEGLLHENKLILVPYSVTEFIIIDLQDGRMESFSCKLQDEDAIEYYIKDEIPAKVLVETDWFDIRQFESYIETENTFVENTFNNTGLNIWNQLKK